MSDRAFSPVFALVFAALLTLTACSAGTLTGPDHAVEQPAPQHTAVDNGVDAPGDDYNLPDVIRDTGDGGGTASGDEFNLGGDDD